jgi:hypothetical protein
MWSSKQLNKKKCFLETCASTNFKGSHSTYLPIRCIVGVIGKSIQFLWGEHCLKCLQVVGVLINLCSLSEAERMSGARNVTDRPNEQSSKAQLICKVDFLLECVCIILMKGQRLNIIECRFHILTYETH